MQAYRLSWRGVTHDNDLDQRSFLLGPFGPMPDLGKQDTEHDQIEDIAGSSETFLLRYGKD